MNSAKKRTVLRIVVILYTLFIFSNSAATGETSGGFSARIAAMIIDFFHLPFAFEPFHFFLRKAAHFSEYALLGILVCSESRYEKSSTVVPWLYGICTAVLDESLQLLVPGRSGSPADVLIDSAGFLCGFALMSLLLHSLVKAPKDPPVS